MNTLTQEDYKNILALISNTPIKGGEAMVVAVLQQKLTKLLTPENPVAKKTTEKTTSNGSETKQKT